MCSERMSQRYRKRDIERERESHKGRDRERERGRGMSGEREREKTKKRERERERDIEREGKRELKSPSKCLRTRWGQMPFGILSGLTLPKKFHEHEERDGNTHRERWKTQ